MNDDIIDSVSIERFAAYLDDNLPPDEMNQISSMVERDGMVHDLLEASKLTEETLSNYSDDDLTLPEEISSIDFELPVLADPVIDTFDFIEVACANADVEDINLPIDADVIMDDSLTDDLSDSISFATDDFNNEASITPDNDGEILPDNNDI